MAHPPAEPTGRLVVHMSGPLLHRRYGTHVPNLSIGGHPPIPLSRGSNAVDLPAGQHHLTIGMGLWRHRPFDYGTVATLVSVVPGQITTVYYAAPAVIWASGVVGATPQAPRGRIQRAALIALVVLPVVLSLAALL
jgi:hypothetical protein